MGMGNAFPKRCTSPNLRTVEGAWLGAGAANMTKVNGSGILSVVRTGAGTFTITFADIGVQVRNATVQVHTLATVAPQIAKVNLATFSTSARTLQLEIWSLAGALTDPAAGTTVHIMVDMSDGTLP